MLRVDIKKFITDHCWFGWYYWDPRPGRGTGFWERSVEPFNGKKRKWKQRIDWDKVFDR